VSPPKFLESTRQHGFIDGFQQPGTEIAMDFDRRIHNRLGDVVEGVCLRVLVCFFLEQPAGGGAELLTHQVEHGARSRL
jgi:hypothetical protein